MKKIIAAFTAVMMLATNVFAVDVEAKRIRTNTSGFNNNLSSADDNVQKSLDTVDNLSITPKTRQLTINGTAQDLTSDRSWSVGTVTGTGATNAFMYWASASAASYLVNSIVDAANCIIIIFSTLGSEKVSNGGFASGSGWTAPSGWAISGGVANHNSNGTGALSQSVGALNRELYRLTFDVGSMTTGTVTVSVGGVSQTAISASGSYSYTFIGTSTASISFTPTNTARFTIDNVSLKKASGGALNIPGTIFTGEMTVSSSNSNSSPGTTRHIYLANPSGGYTWIENWFGSTLRSARGADSSGNLYSYITSGAVQYWYTISGSYFAYIYASGLYHQGFGQFGGTVAAGNGVNAGSQSTSPPSMLTAQGRTGFKTCKYFSSATLDNSCTEVWVNCDAASACTGTPTYSCDHWTNETDCNLRSGHGGCTFDPTYCNIYNGEYGMGSCSGASGCSPATTPCSGGDESSCLSSDDSYGGDCAWTNNPTSCAVIDEWTCTNSPPSGCSADMQYCTPNFSNCSDYQNTGADGCTSYPTGCSSTSNSCSTWNGDESGCLSNSCYYDSGSTNCYEACVGTYFTSCSGGGSCSMQSEGSCASSTYYNGCLGTYDSYSCSGNAYTGTCNGSRCLGTSTCSGISGGSTPCEAEDGCDYATGCSLTLPSDSGFATGFYAFYWIYNAGASANVTILPNTSQTVNDTTSYSLPYGKKSRRFTFFYFQEACSQWSATNSSTCTTGHSGCSWTACSTYNGDESGCNSAGGDCTYDSGMSVCNGNGVCSGTWTITRNWAITGGVF